MTNFYSTDFDIPVSGLFPLFLRIDTELILLSNHWALMYAWLWCLEQLFTYLTGLVSMSSLTELSRMLVRQDVLKRSDFSSFSRISGMQRQIQNFTIIISRPVGNLTGGSENQYGILVPTVVPHLANTWQMWETAEKAGLITANLMWCVSAYLCFW